MTNAPSRTILLVDDSPENLRHTAMMLAPHYHVRIANNGVTALSVARSEPHPDLILLDIMMPDMDGLEVLRQMRETPSTRDIPVIFLTAMASQHDEAAGLALGAVDYITKPVVMPLLLARIQTQLELKNARDWLKDRNAALSAEVARQVVQLQAAKEAAEAASRSKSVFIDTMSHELRTPMNGVIGMLQLAMEDVPADSPAGEYLKIALESSETMVEQLGAILDYSQIAHGEVRLREDAFHLPNLLEIMIAATRTRAAQKGLKQTLVIHDDAPAEVHGDEQRIKQLLRLLIENAIKFTASGEIELGLAGGYGGAHLWVRDTGIGIDPAQHDAIFEAFKQGDGSTTRSYGGLGLGLATARRLVELMGGTLWVESQPGQGSTFHLALPLTPVTELA